MLTWIRYQFARLRMALARFLIRPLAYDLYHVQLISAAKAASVMFSEFVDTARIPRRAKHSWDRAQFAAKTIEKLLGKAHGAVKGQTHANGIIRQQARDLARLDLRIAKLEEKVHDQKAGQEVGHILAPDGSKARHLH